MFETLSYPFFDLSSFEKVILPQFKSTYWIITQKKHTDRYKYTNITLDKSKKSAIYILM